MNNIKEIKEINEKKEIQLTKRDFQIMREIDRWRFLMGRHIKEFTGFTGERACNRRLKALVDNGYLERRKTVYGLPSIYVLSYKARKLIGVSPKKEQLSVGRLYHDMIVLDTAVYVMNKYQIKAKDITTERELNRMAGFGKRKHRPDFVFAVEHQKICVEVELSKKAKTRFLANLSDNYMEYDKQLWIIPKCEQRNRILIETSGISADIEIIDLENLESLENLEVVAHHSK